MKKAIIYGLGRAYNNQKAFLESEFDIVAYADKKPADPAQFKQPVITPAQMDGFSYDCVYVTSGAYYAEIANELENDYAVPKEKILSQKDMWWNIENEEERERWVERQLKLLPPGIKILDAGAGNMRYRKYCAHLNYISQDFGEYDESPKDVALQSDAGAWQSRKCDIISDITDIPLEDESVDAILCTEVFEHLKDPLSALAEFARLLKKGGTLLLTAPFCSLTHMAPFYFTNGFSRYWYEEHLTQHAFTVDEIVPYGNWFSYLAQEMKRMNYMTDRFGSKLSETQMQTMVSAVRILAEQAKHDRGSDEVLCVGFVVRGRKKDE